MEELIKLDTEIDIELERIPKFYTRHVQRSQLLRKYNTANEIFAYCTYTLYKRGRMENHTSYQYNALALRYYELQEAIKVKKQLGEMVRYSNTEQFTQSLKTVNQICNKCKTEIESLKKALKINALPRMEEV